MRKALIFLFLLIPFVSLSIGCVLRNSNQNKVKSEKATPSDPKKCLPIDTSAEVKRTYLIYVNKSKETASLIPQDSLDTWAPRLSSPFKGEAIFNISKETSFSDLTGALAKEGFALDADFEEKYATDYQRIHSCILSKVETDPIYVSLYSGLTEVDGSLKSFFTIVSPYLELIKDLHLGSILRSNSLEIDFEDFVFVPLYENESYAVLTSSSAKLISLYPWLENKVFSWTRASHFSRFDFLGHVFDVLVYPAHSPIDAEDIPFSVSHFLAWTPGMSRRRSVDIPLYIPRPRSNSAEYDHATILSEDPEEVLQAVTASLRTSLSGLGSLSLVSHETESEKYKMRVLKALDAISIGLAFEFENLKQ